MAQIQSGISLPPSRKRKVRERRQSTIFQAQAGSGFGDPYSYSVGEVIGTWSHLRGGGVHGEHLALRKSVIFEVQPGSGTGDPYSNSVGEVMAHGNI